MRTQRWPLVSLLTSALALLVLTAAPRAQTVYGIDGPNGRVTEMSGPSAGPCSYPDGPVASFFNYVQAAVCMGNPVPQVYDPGGFLGQLVGDVTVDRENDIVYVTDGQAIGAFDAESGVLIEHFAPAFLGLVPPLTGLGFDAAGWLWITDANYYAACEPNGSCNPLVQLAATPKPMGVGVLGDIDRDPLTGELWVCDDLGQVTRFNIGAIAPTSQFSVVGAGPACGGLGMLLPGLCVDSTVAGGRVICVTDGVRIARFAELAGGVVGPPPASFAFPNACWPVPGGQAMQGLGFAAHAVTYGPGSLQFDATGESTLPSATLKLRAQGGPAGAAFLLWDFASSCPGLPAFGQPLLLAVSPAWGFLGPVAYAGGPGALNVQVALPAPGVVPIGLTLYLQTFVQSAGVWRSSNGVAFTTSRL